jgi:hypothetical protein
MVDLKELQKEVMRNKIEKGFNTTDIASEFCRAYEELSEAFSKHNKNQPGVAEEFADVTIFLLGRPIPVLVDPVWAVKRNVQTLKT